MSNRDPNLVSKSGMQWKRTFDGRYFQWNALIDSEKKSYLSTGYVPGGVTLWDATALMSTFKQDDWPICLVIPVQTFREQPPDLAAVFGSTPEPPPKSQVQAVLDERGSRYGSWADNSKYARRLNAVMDEAIAHREKTGFAPLTEFQENALDMIFQKISRILSGDASYEDNWIDIAGYAELGRKPR